MVHLNRIYTRVGDDGTTALGDGARLPKHHLRIEAFGSVDEASSVIGLVRTAELPEGCDAQLLAIQNDLLDVGSDLCVPGAADEAKRVGPEYTSRIESWIDEINRDLEPLASFLLPGGKPAAAWLHLARTVTRRAERIVTALAAAEPGKVNAEVVRYLNRLSDLLFVLARRANDDGTTDILWDPGASKES